MPGTIPQHAPEPISAPTTIPVSPQIISGNMPGTDYPFYIINNIIVVVDIMGQRVITILGSINNCTPEIKNHFMTEIDKCPEDKILCLNFASAGSDIYTNTNNSNIESKAQFLASIMIFIAKFLLSKPTYLKHLKNHMIYI